MRILGTLLSMAVMVILMNAGLAQEKKALHAIQKKPLKDVDIDAFTGETQKTIGAQDSINIVWIIPIEFWEASLAQDKMLPEFQRRAFIDALKKYVLVGVVRADVSPLGAFRFHDEKKVFGNLQATFVKTKGEPVPIKLLLKADNDDAQLVIDSLKPVLKAAMGKLGDNFHFFVCNNQDEAGRRLISPYETGKVKVSLGAIGQNKGGTVEVAFPLDSLHVPRICADCGKQAHLSWSYCPFCGKKHPK
jgi:hypothetical protein